MAKWLITFQGQDICIFCALRFRNEPVQRFLRTANNNVRTYKTERQLRQPAGAATALQPDEEEDGYEPVRVRRTVSSNISSYKVQTQRLEPRRVASDGLEQVGWKQTASHGFEEQLDWRCRCGHQNAPRRTECSLCQTPKPQGAGYGRLAHTLPPRGTRERDHSDTRRPPNSRWPPQQTEDFRYRSQPRYESHPAQRADVERNNVNSGGTRFGSFLDNLGTNRSTQVRTEYRSREPSTSSNHPPTLTGFDAFAQAVQGSQNQRSRREPRSRQPTTEVGSNQSRSIPEDIVAPLDDIRDVDGEATNHRRRHDKTGQSTKNRRRQRFDLNNVDDTAADDAPGQQQNKTKGNNQARTRRSAHEIELEAIEEEYYGLSDRYSKRKSSTTTVEPVRPRLEILEYMSVERLAQSLRIKTEDLLERLEEEGFEGARYDHILDAETSGMFADLYGYEPVQPTIEEMDLVARPPVEDMSTLPSRPPIVTIMGHVDHGKTTILDFLRKSSVVAGEHGGITQHIGAFSVVMPRTERRITFLDTPGHAAFLDMRRRGAVVTDIVVLVVAADDSVKPQTLEAIKHALDAKVQIIVAINKIDKEDADIEKVKTDLARNNIAVEDYGGEYQAIPLSGKTGQGMGDLEEAIITLADVSDFRAETDGQAEGWIIESKVTSAGRIATVLIRRGTLRRGDFIVAGSTWARVRTLRNDAGELVEEAPPGTPVQIDGWRGEDPTAGLEVLQAEDEAHAKRVVALRDRKTEGLRDATDMIEINKSKSEGADARAKVLEWRAERGLVGKRGGVKVRRQNNEGWVESIDSTGPKKVHFVVKADVAGSVEAIVAAVNAIGNNEVQANVIHSGTGMLSESDIRMLATSGEVAYAISFNQPIDGTMYRLAEAADLEIMDHNIIYKVTDQVKERVEAELPPLVSHRVLGEAEIGKIFDINVKRKQLKVAGCRITNGTINKSQQIRVLRNNEVIYTGTLHSLKNVKKDVSEMRKDSECGMAFEDWEDFREGDNVQSFEEIREKRKLY